MFSKMEVKSVFVTGANRGIGLEFVRQLVSLPKPPKYVFATYRSKDQNQALEEIAKSTSESKVILIQMDVTKMEDIKSAAKRVENTVGEEGLTFLINNAGLAKPLPFPDLTQENMNLHFNTNAVGPTMVFQELLPSLKKSSESYSGSRMSVSRAAVLNISSMAGSLNDIVNHPKEFLPIAGYRASKAALNMAMRTASRMVEEDGILVLLMCPGWVKTDMGTEMGMITVEESVSTMLDTMTRMDESHHGLFFDRSGNVQPF